jgi:Putative prokaryotic signal transducing protein
MALQDPVAIYNAANNIEAQLVKLWLVESGIEAFVLEDLSTAGIWMFGALPEIHKPQVWISQSDLDRARPILDQYEQEVAERNRVGQPTGADTGSPIEVICDDCEKKSLFPANQRGTIQDCPACGAFVDVGEVDESDPFWLESDEPGEPNEA